MNENAKRLLQQIGAELDCQIFPRVKNGGIVVPSEPAVPSTLGKEYYHESIIRSSAAPRKESLRRKGAPSRRSWSPSQTAPLVGAGLQTRYENELDAIDRAFPGTTVWQQEDGLWLLTESSLLPEIQQAAIFLTGISYTGGAVRAWGFWRQTMAPATWIGPRHTNFPDGSICAFDLGDRTWVLGDSVVELLDLYTLWALRHLHLEVFSRWPGPQVVTHPYERILELEENEYCGCGRYDKLYGACCQHADLARNRIKDAVNFSLCFAGGLRAPPHDVIRFIREHCDPPCINELLLGSGAIEYS